MTDAVDTQAWRADVTADLRVIKAQLGRIASDRESEKGTMLRLEADLKGEDRRNAEKFDEHVDWNNGELGKLHEKVNKLTFKFWFAAGVYAALQLVAPLVWMLLLQLMGVK